MADNNLQADQELKGLERGKRKEDRRVARSRAALRQALKELVQEKGFEAVTVEEIAERANLGRTTFYLHYRDKEDLFLEDFEIILTEMVDQMVSRTLKEWFVENQGMATLKIYEAVQANADIFRVIINEQSNKVFNRFQDIISRFAMRLVAETPFYKKRAGQISTPLNLIFNYFSGAMWSSIVWWVQNDFNLSAQEMNEHYQKMFLTGLFGVLNIQRRKNT